MPTPSQLQIARSRTEAEMTEIIKAGPLISSVNPVTLEATETVQADQTGPAQVKYPTLTVSERQTPGVIAAVVDIIVKRPISAAILPVGHWFEVTASSADPSLVGRRFKVKAPPQSGQTTSHRYPVAEES